jgi:hypothetical protein
VAGDDRNAFELVAVLRQLLIVPVQTVDATPSGLKLFLKVVFIKPGKRFGLYQALAPGLANPLCGMVALDWQINRFLCPDP